MKEYHIDRDGQRYGPFSADQIIEMLQSNQLSISDNCWHEGISEWAPLSKVFNLATPAEPPSLPAAPAIKPTATYYYSTFGDRMGAYIIDIFVFNIIYWILLIVCAFLVEAIFGMSDAIWTAMLTCSILALWLYYALLESSKLKATFGKMACNLIVADMDGKSVSFSKATGRYFAKWISFATFGYGFIMCMFTAKRQCLHDIISGCQVLKKAK